MQHKIKLAIVAVATSVATAIEAVLPLTDGRIPLTNIVLQKGTFALVVLGVTMVGFLARALWWYMQKEADDDQ